MKKFLIILALATLPACSDDVRRPLYPKSNLSVKTINGYFDGKLSTICVDGISYLITEQGGITVKYQSWNDTDPTVEECE